VQYSVRNRRRLRPTGEQSGPTRMARGTGVPEVPSAEAIAQAVSDVSEARVAVKEIVPASVIKQNWQR